ncbi:hypothetical protein GFD30_00695 [Glycomyces sp. NEAU-7082]|uniref:DUF3995 domain-containing protein n=2 Tax=Glycomyces albidus TaxID=2656774 RepID=A0A6L5G368_9ACTN|nr:hypothetical protein [Glycomyces albidus]
MTMSTSDAEAEHRKRTATNWPQWIGYVTAVWSGAYGLLGLSWALGGAAFPFGEENTLLAGAEPEPTGWAAASLGLLGAVIAVAMSRPRPRRRLVGPTAFAWTLAAGLTVLIPDSRPMIALIRAPMMLIGTPLGLVPDDLTAADYFSAFLPWPVVNQLVLMAGGLLWAGTAVAHRRRLDDACRRCGRSDREASRWTSPAAAARWGRWAVAVAVAVPVGYAATRWAWALDIPLGVPQEGLDELEAESPGIWWAGALLATLALGGAVLTLGLVQKWGEVYPRWMPGLRGRTVRPRTAIVPASVIALLITSTGLSYVRHYTLGGADIAWDSWAMYVPQLFFPLWGAGLGAAALAYHLRRRRRCPSCGLG